MNGAEALARTLLAGGVDVCFANPGTSEMHFVGALDRLPEIRCVLGLFEGVVTAAADGYARMAGKPAATLLHLGPGLGNGLANLHNARKACTPMVNVVGDHATFHRIHESPLRSDTEAFARPVSDWIRTASEPGIVSALAAEAIAAARTRPGRIATLILPADAAWGEAPALLAPVPESPSSSPSDPDRLRAAVRALRSGEPTALFVAGALLWEPLLTGLGRLAARTGCRLISQLATPRVARGAGRVRVDRIPYPAAQARAMLAPYRHVIVLGAWPPVSFFGYPGQASTLEAPGAEVIDLGCDVDVAAALAFLLDETGAATAKPEHAPASRAELPPPGRLTVRGVNQCVGALLPDHAILVDEAVTSVDGLIDCTAGAPAHDLLRLTGGAIGIGIPLAAGAAVACPGRRVIGLQADGSGMYTLQGLWTQARERLDVVTVVYSNRGYATLHGELKAVGAGEGGRNARRMIDIEDPALDWVSLARGMGVDGARAATTSVLADLLAAALRRPGPFLIEAML